MFIYLFICLYLCSLHINRKHLAHLVPYLLSLPIHIASSKEKESGVFSSHIFSFATITSSPKANELTDKMLKQKIILKQIYQINENYEKRTPDSFSLHYFGKYFE